MDNMPDNEDATERHDDSRSTRRSRWSRRSGRGPVSLITTAKKSKLDDWRHRKRLYAGLQLARIPLLVLAVVAYGWLHSPVIAAVFAVISLPLPWVAVLLANEQSSDKEKGQPKVYKPALVREQRRMAQTSLTSDTQTRNRPQIEHDHPDSDIIEVDDAGAGTEENTGENGEPHEH